MEHVRGAPNHPQTQGKIERCRQTLKNRILLENHFLPGTLEAAVDAFVDHCNHPRCRENIGNVTPADTCFGREEAIISERRTNQRADNEEAPIDQPAARSVT